MWDNAHEQWVAANIFSQGGTCISSATPVVSLVLQSMEITPKGKKMKMTFLLPKILLLSLTIACQSGAAQTSPSPTAGSQNLSVEKTIREYYTAFEKKDWNLMEQILADGFTFTSPLDDHINIKAFQGRCWPNAYKIKRFDLEKLVVNGDEAFVIYDGWTTEGKLFRNSDYFKLKDGKIRAYECFFGPGINYPNSGK
jgi:ketosteroid isomerase-like protein